MLWDVLPKYIDDWVDTSRLVSALFGSNGTQSRLWHFLLGRSEDGLRIEPEGIVNINAGMIMLTCFLFAALSAKMRATSSMVVGTVLVTVALCLFGLYTLVWFVILAMIIFSIGEMLVERGMTPGQVTEKALPVGEAFQKLIEYTGESPEVLTNLLYANHHVGLTWYFFAAVGVLSAVMIYMYGRWILTLGEKKRASG